MKLAGPLVLSACLLLAGCASTGFAGFLATTPYVKARMGEARSQSLRERQELLQELERVQRDVEDIKRLTGDIDELLRRVTRTEKSTDDLRALTTELQIRLELLPRETLQELVRIIQVHLESTARLKS